VKTSGRFPPAGRPTRKSRFRLSSRDHPTVQTGSEDYGVYSNRVSSRAPPRRRGVAIQLNVKLSAFGLGSSVVPLGALLAGRIAMMV
jgi:hypothetical protein